MAYFPLFIDITGKRSVIIGGGAVAVRKAQVLASFGTQVAVISPDPSPAMESLEKEGTVALYRRRFNGKSDLEGAVLVIAATDDRYVNEEVFKAAGVLGIHVNVADNPALCTFYFPAIVQRGDLVAGITTSGVYPALSARLREELEAWWPVDLALKLKRLGKERKRMLEEIPDPARRRELLMQILYEVLNEETYDEK